ncbi:MAG: SMP-30/gluconolactonase/LRE family protein [Polyangiaceae bacterium]|nr:SMP-30/gluconolactonase/LRE family protein [Polyangiaceae bacterium]
MNALSVQCRLSRFGSFSGALSGGGAISALILALGGCASESLVPPGSTETGSDSGMQGSASGGSGTLTQTPGGPVQGSGGSLGSPGLPGGPTTPADGSGGTPAVVDDTTPGGSNPVDVICTGDWSGQEPTQPGMLVDHGSPSALPDNGGDQFRLEGPVWAAGRLYLSQFRKWGDLPPGRILEFDGTSFTEAFAGAGTNGLAVNAQGQLVAASHRIQGLEIYDLAGGSSTPTAIATTGGPTQFNSPNDLTLRGDGNIYFTDPTWQCGNCTGAGSTDAYRVAPDGQVTAIGAPHGQPNGIALSPSGDTLYVAGDNAGVYSYTVDTAGAVSGGSEFAAVTGVDGLAVDCAGNIYLSVHSTGDVKAFSPSGTELITISVGSAITNLAFGGSDAKTLYITRDDGKLQSAAMNVPGLPY